MSIQDRLRQATGRSGLIVEYRAGFGWFIVEEQQTLVGFQSRRLLKRYLENVEYKGYLYTPTAWETYGR